MRLIFFSSVLDPDVLIPKSQLIRFQGFYKPVNKIHYLINLLLRSKYTNLHLSVLKQSW